MEEREHLIEKETVVDYVVSSDVLLDSATVTVNHAGQQGQLYLRDRSIYAAQYSRLKGNAAAMIMAGWKGATLKITPLDEGVRKNVSLNVDNIQQLQSRSPSSIDILLDDKKFKQAVLLIYSCQFKEAGALLMEQLRVNRYDYTAWLWYSRLLGKVDSIEAAMTEAQKWGNSDQEIWNEMKKLQPFILSKSEEVKRCHFCWTLLPAEKEYCLSCHAVQTIQITPEKENIQEDEIKRALHRYNKILQANPKNSKVAHILALGMYNLGQLKRACYYQNLAVQGKPEVAFYSKGLIFLKQKCVDLGLIEKEGNVVTPVSKVGKSAVVATPKPVQKLSPNKKTILVVEDSKTSRKVISMVLKREGLQTIEATTGEEAIELARDNRPNLILLDVMLPDMTGHDILPQLRTMEHLADIPVIMLTGKTGMEDRIKGMQAGSSEYLTKPFDPQKLTSVIRRYI